METLPSAFRDREVRPEPVDRCQSILHVGIWRLRSGPDVLFGDPLFPSRPFADGRAGVIARHRYNPCDSVNSSAELPGRTKSGPFCT